jgi:hypothetical protein
VGVVDLDMLKRKDRVKRNAAGRGVFGRDESNKFRESLFREADERLELVSAGLAFPKVPHPAGVQILRPLRQENRLPALGAFIDRSRRSIISGAAGL